MKYIRLMVQAAEHRLQSAGSRPAIIPELDKLCQAIGSRIVESLTPHSATGRERKRKRHVVLASEAYGVGGHTRVVEDIALCLGAPDVLVVVTDLYDRYRHAEELVKVDVDVAVLSRGDELAKLEELISLLGRVRPENIFHLGHPSDVIATAALQPALVTNGLFFIHHADHGFALGAAAEGVCHIDLHPRGCFTCRQEFGLDSRYLPLSAAAAEGPRLGSRKGGFVSASSASTPTKMKPVAGMPGFWQAVVDIVKTTGGIHYHIGPLSEDHLQSVYDELQRNLLPRDRFRHIPQAFSVYGALRALGCDLYLASFPEGGGKALVEAMAASVPICMYDAPVNPLLSGIDMAYPQALIWRTRDQLQHQLSNFDSTAVDRHRAYAWEHFLSHHGWDRFSGALNRILRKEADSAGDAPAIRPRSGILGNVDSYFV